MVNRQVGISMERISIQEGFIKDKNWIIGPSIVRCSKKNAPGYGSLLMIATLSDGSDSGAVTGGEARMAAKPLLVNGIWSILTCVTVTAAVLK